MLLTCRRNIPYLRRMACWLLESDGNYAVPINEVYPNENKNHLFWSPLQGLLEANPQILTRVANLFAPHKWVCARCPPTHHPYPEWHRSNNTASLTINSLKVDVSRNFSWPSIRFCGNGFLCKWIFIHKNTKHHKYRCNFMTNLHSSLVSVKTLFTQTQFDSSQSTIKFANFIHLCAFIFVG